MTPITLEHIREAVVLHTDTKAEDVQLGSVLADLGADSLTLAEMLFYIEDKTGNDIDLVSTPATVADLLAALGGSPETQTDDHHSQQRGRTWL